MEGRRGRCGLCANGGGWVRWLYNGESRPDHPAAQGGSGNLGRLFMFGGYEYTRWTIFHVLWLVGATGGVWLGIVVGTWFFGTAGAVAGSIIGLVLGHVAGCLPHDLSDKHFFRRLARSSNEELWAMVAADDWKWCHTMALLQLAARDQDVRMALPRILDMLESDSVLARRFGWDALRIVFTNEYRVIPDYDPRGSTEDCRSKIATLRASLAAAEGATGLETPRPNGDQPGSIRGD